MKIFIIHSQHNYSLHVHKKQHPFVYSLCRAVVLRLISELKPTDEMRNRMDRLYMTIRKTPPPDVSAVIVANPCLIDMLRGLAGKQITKEQIARMSALITSFPQSDNEGEKKHG